MRQSPPDPQADPAMPSRLKTLALVILALAITAAVFMAGRYVGAAQP